MANQIERQNEHEHTHEITALIFPAASTSSPASHSSSTSSSNPILNNISDQTSTEASTLADRFTSALKEISALDTSSSTPAIRTIQLPTVSPALRLQFTTTPSFPLSILRTHPSISAFESTHACQITLQPSATYLTPKKLVVFDMDSTLIEQEVIDLLAAHAGVEAQVSSITARAMNGELDFSASLRERVGLLKDLPLSTLKELRSAITITPGVEELLAILKENGVKTAVLSGGFMPLAAWLALRLGIDYGHANSLEVDTSTEKLTGRLKEGCVIVDGERKRVLLREIAAREGIEDMRAVAAVGDGANDLPMLWEAGLGIAINAKPSVQARAPVRLNGPTAMRGVGVLLGLVS